MSERNHWPKAERPTRSPRPLYKGDHEGYEEQHPAYGVISVSRVSMSPGQFLYASDFRHQRAVHVRLHHSDVQRTNNRSYRHPGGTIADWVMSEAQWATFVSSFGEGGGTPVTLQYLTPEPGPGHIPSIVPLADERERLREETVKPIQDALDALEAVMDTGTKAQREAAKRAADVLRSNIPWVRQNFDEHAEKVTESMRVELAAYFENRLREVGLEALGGAPPLTLERGDE